LKKDHTMSNATRYPFPASNPGHQQSPAPQSERRSKRRVFDSARSLSALLLGAMISAMVVVADQLIETWADGHLLVAWVALWLVSFTALALFAGSAHQLSNSVVDALGAMAKRRAGKRADEHLWAMAQADPRLMADLQGAMARRED
jgi:hypothetical protein